jgi:hypothetical protein
VEGEGAWGGWLIFVGNSIRGDSSERASGTMAGTLALAGTGQHSRRLRLDDH